jgi:hypothetical protein
MHLNLAGGMELLTSEDEDSAEKDQDVYRSSQAGEGKRVSFREASGGKNPRTDGSRGPLPFERLAGEDCILVGPGSLDNDRR